MSDRKTLERAEPAHQSGLDASKGSFIPPRRQRELRDLSRHRAPLVEEKTRISNRIERAWEDANIKLGSVASEVMGVSGRAMIQALLASEKVPAQMADLGAADLTRQDS